MNKTPDPTDAEAAQPRDIRFLKTLVTMLTITMIVGLIVLIGLFVMRFTSAPTAQWPENLALPAGVAASAVTRGPDWLAVVTEDGRILILSPDGQTILQEVEIKQ
ncbi:MAG TPA: hypothetical protein ENK28_08595 [Aliiroseovarius sp.]|nr:hypothetical protein [Aliiroseovarius sp.]